MKAFYNPQVFDTLEFGIRNTIKLIADRYEKEVGARNSREKLFIYVDKEHEVARRDAIKSGDKAKAKVFAASLGVVQDDGTVDFLDPQLSVFIVAVMGNSKNRNVKNVELEDGFITSNDTLAPFQHSVRLEGLSAPAPQAPKAEEKEAEEKPKATRKSKKKAEDEDEDEAEAEAENKE
jgi:hypothetical protein